MQIKTKIVSCHTANSKPVKQEVNSTVILPPFSIPCLVSFTLSVINKSIMLSGNMQSGIMMNVVLLNVVAPNFQVSPTNGVDLFARFQNKLFIVF